MWIVNTIQMVQLFVNGGSTFVSQMRGYEFEDMSFF